MPLSRRTFLKNSALVSTGIGITAEITIPSESLFIDKPYNMLFAPHFGMFENHAGKDLLDQIKYMHDRGFRAIEDNGMMGRTPEMQEKIGSLLGKLGMKMGVFVVAFDNWPLQSSMTTGKMSGNKIYPYMQRCCRCGKTDRSYFHDSRTRQL